MRIVAVGATDQSTVIRIVDAADGTPETGVTAATSGLALFYRREGAAAVALTESDLASASAAHADGGLYHLGAGYYRVDVPDAAWLTGAAGVLVAGSATGMVVIGAYHPVLAPTELTDIAAAVWAGAPAGTPVATIAAAVRDISNASPAADSLGEAVNAAAAGGGVTAADVWAHGTRTLSAGTNIVLAKGVGVTGFNDLSAAQVNAEADTALTDAGVTPTVMGQIDATVSSRSTYAGGAVASVTGAVGSVTATVNATLIATGLDAIAVTAPTGVASTFPQMVVQTWRRFFAKATKTDTQIRTYAANGTTVVTTQTVSDDGTTETQGAAT
jgi:hypothetical protein